jgi:hypothetical protein
MNAEGRTTAQICGYVRPPGSLVITGCDAVCPTHGQRGPLIGLTGWLLTSHRGVLNAAEACDHAQRWR